MIAKRNPSAFTKDLLEEIEHFNKTKIPRCQTCKKNYKKVNKYTWKPTCGHNLNLRISIG
jgi:hypothetical protein